MLTPDTFARRRARLSALVGDRPVLVVSHSAPIRNLPMVRHPFRQDSSFLYLTGCKMPGAAALIEAGGASTLFLVPPEPDDPLWHGHAWTLDEVRRDLGFDAVAPLDSLE
ncbi:MAG: aminopeptidase P family protein, partial [Deltaproteobacteria bacterium]